MVLTHESRRSKVVHQRLFALYTGIGHLANLVALEAPPALARKLGSQRAEYLWVLYVEKGISQVALVAEIDGQVEKVIGVFMVLVDEL